MPELITEQVRAKSVSINVPRDNAGGGQNSVRQHVVPMKGMFSAKEAEKVGLEMAKELGVSDDAIHIETYKNGEAPMTANPRHRGSGHHWDKRPSEPTEVKRKPFLRERKVWGGWTPPTPEELAEFEQSREGN